MNRSFVRKIPASILALSVIISISSCERLPAVSEETVQIRTATDTLINHMSEEELSRVEKTDLMLLDEPWNSSSEDDGEYAYLSDAVAIEIWNSEDYIAALDPDDEYYQQYLEDIQLHPEEYDNRVSGFIIHGEPDFYISPDPDYDGYEGTVRLYHYDPAAEDSYYDELVFEDYDELKQLVEEDLQSGVDKGEMTSDEAVSRLNDIIDLYDAIIGGTAVILEPGTINDYLDYYYEKMRSSEDDSGAWEFDKEEVEAISDYITEYHFYDEELDRVFVVHVTTPPDYDPAASYGALVMTDAVWRFKDVVNLRREMEEGRADDKLLVTIGLEYTVDNTDNDVRSDIFCTHRREFLDFIADNLMPYLSDVYKVDCSRSCLFGHSQGGIFTHYALFNSDLYENQPFAEYIIGSPAFWTPYFTDEPDRDEYKNDYGYFERNATLDKFVILTGGDKEDADYEEYYGDNDSTLEGLLHLKERLDDHGADGYFYKLYESNHYMYVGDMLIEYIDGLMYE